MENENYKIYYVLALLECEMEKQTKRVIKLEKTNPCRARDAKIRAEAIEFAIQTLKKELKENQ